MLNLLRFSDDGGTESYGRYAAAAQEHLARVGGSMLWAGACEEALIGPQAREWDVVAVVRYPSRAAFLEMVSDPGYQAIVGGPLGRVGRLAADPLRRGARQSA